MQLDLSPGARYHLQRIVNTREADAAAKHAPGSVADLEQYAEGTASQLLILQVSSGVSCVRDSPALLRPCPKVLQGALQAVILQARGLQTSGIHQQHQALTVRGHAVQGVCRRQHRG